MSVDIGGIRAKMELETGSLEGDLAKVRKRFQEVTSAIEELQQDLKVGTVTADHFEVQLEALMSTQDALRSRTEKLTAALKDEAKAHAAAGTRSSSTRAAQSPWLFVNPQATRPLLPTTTNGAPGSVTPVTRRSPPAPGTCMSAQWMRPAPGDR